MAPGTGHHWAPQPTSRRSTPLPLGWKRIRANVLDRDGHQCTLTENGQRCMVTTGLEADHIGDPDDHSMENLRTLCHDHHSSRTGRQAAAAKQARQAALIQRTQRPHPGLIA